MLGAELEKSSAPRCDIEGNSRPQLKVVMWAVMEDMFVGCSGNNARAKSDAPHYTCVSTSRCVGVRLTHVSEVSRRLETTSLLCT